MKVEPIEPGSEHDQALEQALDLIELDDPELAAQIRAAIEAGAVDFVDLLIPKWAPRPTGAADSNTVAIEFDRQTVADIAGDIVHEWKHVQWRAQNGANDNGSSEPCEHAGVFAAQLNLLCFISCFLEEEEGQVSCEKWKDIKKKFDSVVDQCEASGGTPNLPPTVCNPPTGEPTCGCK